MFDRKNDVARNKKRADAIVYAGAADEVVLTQSDFESEEEFFDAGKHGWTQIASRRKKKCAGIMTV